MTDKYAVFGNPIAHSKSPEIHRQFAEQTKQDLSYSKQLVAEDGFEAAADAFFADGGKGLNITVPFKQDAYSYVARTTPRARRAGAVNTLSMQADGTVLGDTTDGVGLVNDIVHNEMVDQLRIEFPTTNIFTIPTGWTSVYLDQMNTDNELSDDITRFGPQATSLFVDNKGHQGDIIREAGALLWLKSIYSVDLNTFSYDTGFNTNLNEIVNQIVDSHDPNYKL